MVIDSTIGSLTIIDQAVDSNEDPPMNSPALRGRSKSTHQMAKTLGYQKKSLKSMNAYNKEEKIDLKSLRGFLIGTRSSLTFRRVLQQDENDIVEQGRFVSLVTRE